MENYTDYDTWVVVASSPEKYDIRAAQPIEIVYAHSEEQPRMDKVLKRINTFAYRLSACKSIQKIKWFSDKTLPLSIKQFEQKYA